LYLSSVELLPSITCSINDEEENEEQAEVLLGAKIGTRIPCRTFLAHFLSK
jgi:hypothetical protein